MVMKKIAKVIAITGTAIALAWIASKLDDGSASGDSAFDFMN